MPDVFALANRASLARIRAPEIAIAVADDQPDATASTRARLDNIGKALSIQRGVIDALEGRIKQRPPLPPPPPVESLQSLVRRGRRRLERERQGGSRALHDVRLDAVGRLRVALED
jgi:hypothetical protein